MSGKLTAQQTAVEDVLLAQGAFRSAQEVYAALRAAGHRVGLATVYRHLQAFAEQGRADVVRRGDGEMGYRLCQDNTTGRHHHHLICRQCGHTEEIKAPAVERWATQTADTFGYVDTDHTVELFGICPTCAHG